jgi:hypothetical protein
MVDERYQEKITAYFTAKIRLLIFRNHQIDAIAVPTSLHSKIIMGVEDHDLKIVCCAAL